MDAFFPVFTVVLSVSVTRTADDNAMFADEMHASGSTINSGGVESTTTAEFRERFCRENKQIPYHTTITDSKTGY